MKENNIEELKQMLEELYQTQQARLDVGADDLDIREEIAEVEEEIKELQDDTNVNRENSIKNEQSSIENIKILEGIIKGDEDCINAIYSQMKVKNDNDEDIQYYKKEIQSIKNIVNNYLKEKARADKREIDYKRVLKENERLQKENEELREDRDKFKKALGKRITYCNELEKDLFENCSKYVIPIQKIKDKIKEYKNMLKTCNKVKDIDRIKAINERILELEELLEGRR